MARWFDTLFCFHTPIDLTLGRGGSLSEMGALLLARSAWMRCFAVICYGVWSRTDGQFSFKG